MLVIRLQRTGRENLPTYRMVVAEKSAPVKKKFLEIVGHYLPARTPNVMEFQTERIAFWIGKGARPSDTAARLLRRSGMKDLEKFIVPYAKRKPRKEEPKAEAAPPATAEGSPSQQESSSEAKEEDDTGKKEG